MQAESVIDDWLYAFIWALLATVLIGCGAHQPPCTQESVSALRQLYEHAARDVIESGACDAVQRVEDCVQYRALETHFAVASTAMCGGAK